MTTSPSARSRDVGPLVSLLVLALAAAPLAAETPIDPARHDMRPLLQVQAVGSDFAGQPFEANLLVDRGGPTLYAFTQTTGNNRRIERPLAPAAAIAALNKALAAHAIRRVRGGCGQPAPDYVSRYSVTWSAANGRAHTFQVGGDYTGCDAATTAILDAICAYAWTVIDGPIELCVPRDAR